MGEIHQVYLLSMPEGSSTEAAHRRPGYATRATSLEPGTSASSVAQIEGYLDYHLPRDTPAESKAARAIAAPRRLLYIPNAGAWQLLTQICHRAAEGGTRTGSSFAHVLLRNSNEGGSAWSALDCLRLWAAPGWAAADADQQPSPLPRWGALHEMLAGRRPAIDDQVLSSFLTTPAGGAFDDPAEVIPSRWRRKEPAVRRSLLVDALDGLLEIGAAQRAWLLLVAEPELAALLFYGMLRLLPRGTWADGASVSTFEPRVDSLCTVLAATTFYDPSANELRPEIYRSGGLAINTYTQRRSDRLRPMSTYAPYIVARLCEQGWPAVDRMLENMRACGAADPAALEHLVTADRLLPVLLSSQTSPDDSWRHGPMAVEYVRRVLTQELAGLGSGDARLASLAGMPAQRLLLELVAGEGGAARPAIAFLLGVLPLEWIGEVAGYASVSAPDKADLLARYVAHRGELPTGYDWVWEQAEKMLEGKEKSGDAMLIHILTRLDAKGLTRFYQGVASARADIFLPALLETCRLNQSRWEPLSPLVRNASGPALLTVYHRRGRSFFTDYPRDEPAMPARLRRMLQTLTEHPMSFFARLDVILAGQELLGEKERQRALTWDHCRKALYEISRLSRERRGLGRRRPLAAVEEACRRMTDAAAEALPADAFPNDETGVDRQKFVEQLGARVDHGEPLMPAQWRDQRFLWQKIRQRFATGQWPDLPLTVMQARARRAWLLRWGWLILLLAALLIVAAILAFRWYAERSTETTQPPATAANSSAAALPPVQPLPPNNTPRKDVAASASSAGDWVEKPAEVPVHHEVAQPAPAVESKPSDAQPAAAPRHGPAGISVVEPPEGTPVIRGDLRVSRDAHFDVSSDTIAALTPWLTDAFGHRLTPSGSANRRCVVRCTLAEVYSDGTEHPRPVPGERSFDRVFIAPGVTQVRVQFHFFRHAGPLGETAGREVAVTPWYVIDKVERGTEYSLGLELPDRETQRLEQLLDGTGPRTF